MRLVNFLRRLLGDRRGNVAAVFVLALPILTGVTGFAVEYGNALVVRTVNQRVADDAAMAAALAYNSAGTTAAMSAAASRITALNGRSDATATATLVTSPSGNGRSAVQVTLAQNVPVVVSTLFNGKTQLAVAVTSTAELVSQAPNCIIALDAASTGAGVSGGANITANRCGVASNAQVAVANCGAYIQSSSITYNTNLNVPANCGGTTTLRKADGTAQTPKKQPVTDPYAGNAVVAAATARLTTVAALTAPSAPSISVGAGGSAIDFGYNATSTKSQATANGCTAAQNGNTWIYSCAPGSIRKIGTITIQGGIKVTFNDSSCDPSRVLTINSSIVAQDQIIFGCGTYYINGNYTGGYGGTIFRGGTFNITGFIDVGNSGTVTFGDGTYNIGQGLYLNGSTTTTFGVGTFNIGKGIVACGGAYYSICALSSGGTTFGGPSTFSLPGGIRTGGGARLTLGSGTSNSYQIGVSSDGYAFRGDGGAVTTLADSTSISDGYRFAGNVNLVGGGSCLVIGAAAQHDIKGNLWATGAMRLGAGTYTVTGSINFGGSGGGNATCGGSNIGLYADQVTFVVGAASGSLATSGDCSGQAFCLSAGYSSVTINAPSGGSAPGFAVIGPQSTANTAGANFTSGASSSVITGVFYLPNGPISLSGGAGLGSGTGCLELVGKSVTVTAGAVLGSSCTATGAATSFKARIVQ